MFSRARPGGPKRGPTLRARRSARSSVVLPFVIGIVTIGMASQSPADAGAAATVSQNGGVVVFQAGANETNTGVDAEWFPDNNLFPGGTVRVSATNAVNGVPYSIPTPALVPCADYASSPKQSYCPAAGLTAVRLLLGDLNDAAVMRRVVPNVPGVVRADQPFAVPVEVFGEDGNDTLDLTGLVSTAPVLMDGGNGSDHLVYDGTAPAEIRGGAGNDLISSAPVSGLRIDAGPGDDIVNLTGSPTTAGDLSCGPGLDTVTTGSFGRPSFTLPPDCERAGPHRIVVQAKAMPGRRVAVTSEFEPVFPWEGLLSVTLVAINRGRSIPVAVKVVPVSAGKIPATILEAPRSALKSLGRAGSLKARVVVNYSTPSLRGGALGDINVPMSFASSGVPVAVSESVAAGTVGTGGVVSGVVLVRLPGGKGFTRVTGEVRLAAGMEFDARKGSVRITPPGQRGESAVFSGGLFVYRQVRVRRRLTAELRLSEPLACGAAVRASGKKGAKRRQLWGDGKGAFRTRGKSASAGVRGTRWLTADTCAATLVRVVRGSVSVRDLVRRRTVIVRAGERYTAPSNR